jgi:hypothetical protein
LTHAAVLTQERRIHHRGTEAQRKTEEIFNAEAAENAEGERKRERSK